MIEGTKLGEFNDDQEFNTAVKREKNAESDLQGTKIGQISEFEQALLDDDKRNTQQVKDVQTPAVNQVKETIKIEKEVAVEPSNMFQKELDKLVADYQEGDIIKGIVRSVEKSGIMVDIQFKSDGYIARDEFSNDPNEDPQKTIKPGDEISVFIVKLESKEGYTVLSKKRADYEVAWTTVSKFSKTKETVDVFVSSKVQGGLVADYKGIKGFIPASQVLNVQDVSELDQFLGKPLEVCVLQADRKRRKVIFSYKMAKMKTQKKDITKLLDSIEVGHVKSGRVTSVKDFGVFVDLGGIEGLVHISELSWSRVSHPSEIVKVGDTINVFILGVDKENNRISLGMKQLEADPWVKVAETYAVGQLVKGTITRTTTFGAFIRIADNLEGLIHISELSFEHVNKVEDVVTPGQEVEAKIIKLVPDEQKIGLSLKGSAPEVELNKTEEVASDSVDAKEETVAESAQ